jgi:hypothetical protein
MFLQLRGVKVMTDIQNTLIVLAYASFVANEDEYDISKHVVLAI